MVTRVSVGTPLEEATDHFLLNLENRRDRSPNTVSTYRGAIAQFGRFLADTGMPTEVESIKREHVEAWLDALKARGSAPATRQGRLAALKSLFAFLIREDYLVRSPVEKVQGIRQPERLTPILTEADVDAMRRVMRTDIRARAIFELLLDTGLRRAELAALTVADVDRSARVVHVRHGKGDKERLSRFTRTTAEVLFKYIAWRKKHAAAATPWLWLGHRGRLTDAGIEELLKAKAEAAGISSFHMHRLRHTWADKAQRAGMSLSSLMAMGGWSSYTVMSRYGKSAAQMRALEEYDKVFDGD
ncbi:MAG: tyrosine-type recombinase/integrase [Chloroflexi bacterium]|nr:tyrosine-type recombinase/integrase [Chloroflexota bacterium]